MEAEIRCPATNIVFPLSNSTIFWGFRLEPTAGIIDLGWGAVADLFPRFLMLFLFLCSKIH
jgi:hypothetical protein